VETKPSFLARHEFLIRRLHSLSGLIPVGAYMCIHLLTNASVWISSATFQSLVNQIHTPGPFLWIIEWTFIFIPILFHAIIGVVIIRGGLPNYGSYKYTSNLRYTLQRATGMIAFVFILWHVFHMHGWFHFDLWKNSVATPLGGAKFSPYSAASTLGEAMRGVAVPLLYAVGVLSCVFHLANGMWTMGITWGLWITPAAQRRADRLCIGFGILIAVIGLSALGGAVRLANDEDVYNAAIKMEERNLKSRIDAGIVDEETADHKRAHRTGERASSH
jgi:succinate dehydrogenase / fumarate reductase cytochrome b subunit